MDPIVCHACKGPSDLGALVISTQTNTNWFINFSCVFLGMKMSGYWWQGRGCGGGGGERGSGGEGLWGKVGFEGEGG